MITLMEQINQKNSQAVNTKSQNNDFLTQVKTFFSKMSKKDKISYSLITVGVVFIIIGLVLW